MKSAVNFAVVSAMLVVGAFVIHPEARSAGLCVGLAIERLLRACEADAAYRESTVLGRLKDGEAIGAPMWRGTVYYTLRDLETQGLVVSREGPDAPPFPRGGRPRRIYSIAQSATP